MLRWDFQPKVSPSWWMKVASFCLSLVLATVSMTTTKRLLSEEACWGLELCSEPVTGPLVMFPLKSVSLLYTVQNQPEPWRAWAQRLDCCMSNDVRSEHMCSTLSRVSTCKPHTCHEGMNPKHDSCKDISETLSSDITFLFYYEFGKKRQSSNSWRLTLVMNKITLFYYNVD